MGTAACYAPPLPLRLCKLRLQLLNRSLHGKIPSSRRDPALRSSSRRRKIYMSSHHFSADSSQLDRAYSCQSQTPRKCLTNILCTGFALLSSDTSHRSMRRTCSVRRIAEIAPPRRTCTSSRQLPSTSQQGTHRCTAAPGLLRLNTSPPRSPHRTNLLRLNTSLLHMPRRKWPHCLPKRCLRGSLCRPQLQSRANIFLRRSRCKRWLPTASISLRNIAPRNSMPPWRRSTAQQCNPCIQMPQLQSRSPLGTRSGRRKPQPPKASLRRTRCSSSLPLRKNICLRGIGGTLRRLCSFP